VTFLRRLSLNENSAQVTLVSEPLDCGLKDRLFFLLEKNKNLRCRCGRHLLKNFVRLHVLPDTMTASPFSSTRDTELGTTDSSGEPHDVGGAATESAGGASASIFPAKRFVM
jgi:hypothetical protein